jgi:hypothetical protein
MMDEKINVRDIFEKAKCDPTLFSTMDIENILKAVEHEKNDYLHNKTMENVIKDIFDCIDTLPISITQKELFCEKLIGYRYIEDIHELFKGRHIRWIRLQQKDPEKIFITNGGILVDVKFTRDGIQLMCKNNRHQFIQYKFDDCLTFQKLSTEEQLLLIAYENSVV